MRLSLFGPESLVFASLFLTFLRSSSLCRSIKTGKKEPGQYPTIFDLTPGQSRTCKSLVKSELRGPWATLIREVKHHVYVWFTVDYFYA